MTRITNVFVSDYDIMSTFCAPLEKLTFTGFDHVIQEGKIVESIAVSEIKDKNISLEDEFLTKTLKQDGE